MFDKLKKIMSSNNGNIVHKKETTILVVEDSDVDRELIIKLLTKEGYRVLTATNGEIGLTTAKTEKPDLVLLDCEMPVMGGVEMCKEMKNFDQTALIPVIFLTSVQTPRNIVDCFELDAENYLSKPVSTKILLSAIQDVLTERSPS